MARGRKDPRVIEQCEISGIPPDDKRKVYCDRWTTVCDERFGSGVRLQQALMYFHPDVDDCLVLVPARLLPHLRHQQG